MQCKECKKNFSSLKSLQKHREISCFGNSSKKTGVKKIQVERLVLDDAEQEGNQVSEPWKQTASHNEQMKQLFEHHQQLKQQKKDIQKRLAAVMEELKFNNASGCSTPYTTRTADDIPRFSRNTDEIKSFADEKELEPPDSRQIRKLREEYLKHGGQHPSVLKQMRNMEIEAKFKDDEEQSPKLLMKSEKKKTRPQQSSHELKSRSSKESSHVLNSRSSKESVEDQSEALMQQIVNLECENQYLQSQLETLMPQVPQIKDEKNLEDINRKHQKELALLQQKIEIVKRQQELNQYEKELEETIAGHRQKSVQPLMITPKLTSNRYILPSSRNEMRDLYVQCDYISGLPPDITQCHVILYHFTECSTVRVEGIPMSPVTCTRKSNPYQTRRKGSANSSYEGFAYIGKKQQIPSDLHYPNLYLVVELQVHWNSNTSATRESSKEYFQTQAWTKIKITDIHLQPVIGKCFVPLKILPIIAKMSEEQFDAVPQFWKAEFYYQISNSHVIPNQSEMINKHLYSPAKQTLGYYPKMRYRQVPSPPTETPLHFDVEEYSLHVAVKEQKELEAKKYCKQIPPVKVDLGVMTIKRYSTLLRSLELEPHHQMKFSVIPKTPLWGGVLTPMNHHHQAFAAADLSMVNFSVILYWVKGAKPISGKLTLTAFHTKEQKVVESLSGPVTFETDYVETSFRYGYHMFGDLKESFQDIDVHKEVIIIIKFYQLEEKEENFKVKNISENITLKENVVAWTALPLLKNSRQDFVSGYAFHPVLNTGPHSLKLCHPPVPKLSNILDNEADHHWTKYGDAILHMDIFAETEGPSLEIETDGQSLEILDEDEDEERGSNQNLIRKNLKSCYIFVDQSSPPSEAFMADNGFDIYIDGCRFLPDSVSYTRVAGRIIDRNYKKYAGDISAVAKINSDIFNPIYGHKEEFREPDPPATATLLLKVYSKNPEQKGLIVVGFAAINIFVELGTNKQPTGTHSGIQVSLNEGAFQLRLYWKGPDYVSPMSASYLNDNEICPIPCASILVRICKAPKTDMGTTLSCNRIPKEEWERCRVWEEAPDYKDAVYISASCSPTSNEMLIFPDLLTRPIQIVRDIIKVSPRTSLNEKLKQSTSNVEKYIRNQLIKGLDDMPANLDLNKISRYQPEWGIKVAVDVAINLPWSGFTLAHICLNPPAIFYKKTLPYGVDKLKFIENLNLEKSTNTSPVWKDGFKSFPSRSFNPYLTVIIHLREIQVELTTKGTYKFSLREQAWTAVQVFTKQYAITEPFELPLFNGSPPVEILDQLSSQPCQKCIQDNILKNKITSLDNASVFVRLCDARRSDELPTSIYHRHQIPINSSYLALTGKKYQPKENPGQSIRTLIPIHRKPEQFMQTISESFKELIHKYQNQEEWKSQD